MRHKVGMADTDNDLYKREIFVYDTFRFYNAYEKFFRKFLAIILECFLLYELESPEFITQEFGFS